MAWTTPSTWSVAQKVTADDMNEQVRDNLTHLYNRLENNDLYNADGADYTTTSGSFVAVDATNYNYTITTNGGEVMCGFFGWFYQTSGSYRKVSLNVYVDGSPYAGDDGIIGVEIPTDRALPCGFVILIEDLSEGSHTFELRWESQSSATITLFAGSGSTNRDVHPQFWVQEI
jgi:hypothetical protein